MSLPQTTNDRIHNTFVSADAHAFMPFIETHCETAVMWRTLYPRNPYTAGDVNVSFDLPTTYADLCHRLFLDCDVAIHVGRLVPANASWATGDTPAKLRFHRMGIGALITNWSVDHNGVNVDRGDRLRWRLERNFSDNDDDYLETIAMANGQMGPKTWLWDGVSMSYKETRGNYHNFDVKAGTTTTITVVPTVGGVSGTASTSATSTTTANLADPEIPDVETLTSNSIANYVTRLSQDTNRQFYHSVNFNGNNAVSPLGLDVTWKCRYELPWWAAYNGTNQVLPVRNLRTPPQISFLFEPAEKCATALVLEQQYLKPPPTSIPAGYTAADYAVTVTIKNPVLTMLSYNIPARIYDRDFPFEKQISWYKPDYQSYSTTLGSGVGSNTEFDIVINNINRSVQSLAVIVRYDTDVQNFQRFDHFQRAFETLYFNVAGDGILAKEALPAPFILQYIKRKYFVVNHFEELRDGPVPVYCLPMGIDGNLSRPGFGSINFANFTNALHLKGKWSPEWLAKTYPYDSTKLNKDVPIRIDVIGWTQNIVTYFSGNLMKQLQ